MLKTLFLPLLLSASAAAQSDCSKPVIQLVRNGQEISSAAGSALVPSVTLQVTPEAGCPEGQRYQFRNAQLTLVRKGRPALPSLKVSQPQLDLQYFLKYYQSGDHLLVFIAYQDVDLVSSDGSLTPLLSVKDARSKPGKLDLLTDDAKGISFRWPLQKP